MSKFRKILAELNGSPPVTPKDLRGCEVGPLDMRRMLRRHGILIFEFRDEGTVLEKLTALGASPMEQYETVRQNLEPTTRLETLAKTSGGVSSAGIDKHTSMHQDAYQYGQKYRGRTIAGGPDNLPYVEVLGYPRVVEERWLSFYDLGSAARNLAGHGEHYVELLTKPIFTIDPKYKSQDPELEDPGLFPILFLHKNGVRFRLGGGVLPTTSEASTALALFLDEASNSKKLTIRLQPDMLFLVLQARIAHRGVRTVGRDGLTVLTRELWDMPEVGR